MVTKQHRPDETIIQW